MACLGTPKGRDWTLVHACQGKTPSSPPWGIPAQSLLLVCIGLDLGEEVGISMGDAVPVYILQPETLPSSGALIVLRDITGVHQGFCGHYLHTASRRPKHAAHPGGASQLQEAGFLEGLQLGLQLLPCVQGL